MDCKIYRIDKNNHLPNKANTDDAGSDCYSAEEVVFDPGDVRLVALGIIAQAPKGYHFKLCLRSSMAKKRGFMLANGVGIIDSSFSGENDEIKALLYATKKETILKGERICQLILEKNNNIKWLEQEDKNFAGKNRGGWGSSGK